MLVELEIFPILGYLSWYDMNDGTLFSKQACYILEKYSKDLDLETMLKMVRIIL
jgi:hypothetical protein